MSSPTCTVCNKPVPLPPLVCLDCSKGVAPDSQPEITYYCSTNCQAADQAAHSKKCRSPARQRIYRAGHILHSIFTTWRMHTFDIKVKDIKKDPNSGKLMLTEGHYTTQIGDGPLYPFPEQMVKDPKDKAALLSFSYCNDTMMYFSELCGKLFQGITTCIEEVVFLMNFGTLAVERTHGRIDTGTIPHQAFSIEATDGQSYVVDLSGAQFSQHKAVRTLEEYMQVFAVNIDQVHLLGQAATDAEAIRSGEKNSEWGPNNDMRVFHLQHAMHSALLDAVRMWETDNAMKIGQLLDQSQEDFNCNLTSLLMQVDRGLHSFVEQWKQNGRFIKPHPGLPIGEGTAPIPEAKVPVSESHYPKDTGSRAYKACKSHWEAKMKAEQRFQHRLAEAEANAAKVVHYNPDKKEMEALENLVKVLDSSTQADRDKFKEDFWKTFGRNK